MAPMPDTVAMATDNSNRPTFPPAAFKTYAMELVGWQSAKRAEYSPSIQSVGWHRHHAARGALEAVLVTLYGALGAAAYWDGQAVEAVAALPLSTPDEVLTAERVAAETVARYLATLEEVRS